jgi:5'-3' exonuclease
MLAMNIHLIDGTYELFRAFYGAPASASPDGREVGATRGLLRSLLSLLSDPDVTHVACAFDHVIESFRNQLFVGYKTGDGIEPALLAQFELAERATQALGIVTWPMVEFEADDALATFAARSDDASEVSGVVICSPDKDLAQCVRGERVVCFDRMRKRRLDEAAVIAKFGVPPGSIPDWLALVGDTADGIPGIKRWGEKSAAAVLARYLQIEHIPDDARAWEVVVRGASALAAELSATRKQALLYRELATLRRDVPLPEKPSDLAWRGPEQDALRELAAEIGDDRIVELTARATDQRTRAQVPGGYSA